MASNDLSRVLPRVLIVSRRTVRKNKFVDFVGEYHLDLIVAYGAVPVIVPRVTGVHMLLESFQPVHGVLLCEGEDIDPSLYHCDTEASALSLEELDEIRRLHSSDTAIDREKDSIELRLAKLCLERNIPYLGICRGSQVLNVACGGTLYQDVGKELGAKLPEDRRVIHMDYDNYDGHRHPVRVVEKTPLADWFGESLGENTEICVNSYHHQGVKKLAQRFVPMALAADGLVEGFYDPDAYNPEEGKFIMGLQFHPERMRRPESDEFNYPGCPKAYQEFVKAVVCYQKKQISTSSSCCIEDDDDDLGAGALKPVVKLNQEMEKQRKTLIKSFSLARNMYETGNYNSSDDQMTLHPYEESQLKAGAEFLESSRGLSEEQERRLKQMGATVRNGGYYMQEIRMKKKKKKKGKKRYDDDDDDDDDDEREKLATEMIILEKMSAEQLWDFMSFYGRMAQICSQLLHKKLAS